MIYLAADHRGFQLKEAIKKSLIERGFEVEDRGALAYDALDDYVDFASAAAEKIAKSLIEREGDLSRASEASRGIFLCGSGHGVDIVANKFRGVRAALCWNTQVAKESREHGDGNVLVLPADWLDEARAQEIVSVWLGASFSGEDRHIRRLEKIEEIEKKNFK